MCTLQPIDQSLILNASLYCFPDIYDGSELCGLGIQEVVAGEGPKC